MATVLDSLGGIMNLSLMVNVSQIREDNLMNLTNLLYEIKNK